MTGPQNTVPCFYLSAQLLPGTFLHKPNIAKETGTARTYENSLPFASNVYTKVCLTGGRFRTNDPNEVNHIVIVADTRDHGIPLSGGLERVPFVLNDPPTEPLTIHVMYSIDRTYQFVDALNSFTFHGGGLGPGTHINLTLRGHHVTEIATDFTLNDPSPLHPKQIWRFQEEPPEHSMMHSAYNIAVATGALPGHAIRRAQDNCSLQ